MNNAQTAPGSFLTTAVSGNTSAGSIHQKTSEPATEFLAQAVLGLYETYRNARTNRETVWLESWATYFGTPEAEEFLRQRVARLVGDVNDDWRHRIASGKGYEIIETINAYLQTAFFPSSDWFDVVPAEDPELADVAKATKRFVSKKLREAQFTSYWETYIRQLLVTGFSVLALPWETRLVTRKRRIEKEDEEGNKTYPAIEEEVPEYDNISLEVLDSFDCFLDPSARDINRANFIRVMRQEKATVMRKIATKEYDRLNPASVVATSVNGRTKMQSERVSRFLGMEYDPKELVDVLEFWGDITVEDVTYHDVVITVVGSNLARVEPNPYWGGRPFIIGTAIPVPGRPYGLSPLEPVLGMIHQLNVLSNQRLDNLELLVDTMWGYVPDGVTDPADMVTEPGKIIPMATPGNVFPLQRDGNGVYVSYQETNLLEINIDKTVGVGAYIGTQQGRKGERVTAQEIQAVRDAGGNRLSSIHGHIENTQLHAMLVKTMMMCRQYVTYDEVIRYPGQRGEQIYAHFGPRELMFDYEIMPVGAEYIANKERQLQQVVDFVNLVSQVPQWTESIDWEELLRMASRRFGFSEDIDKFLKQPVPQAPAQEMAPQAMPQGAVPPMPEAPVDEAEMLKQLAYQSGGVPMVNAVAAENARVGPEQALANVMQS
jgi:hypothetical protein